MRHFIPIVVLAVTSIQAQSGTCAEILEEIVITAQKREQLQQDVPISLTVVTGHQLQTRTLRDLASVSAQQPNLHIGASAIGDKIFLRGIGSGINAGFEQAVATFVDGLHLGRSAQTRNPLFDLDRIEVLRGPQSLYFGNAAIAGALNINTRKPGWNNSGYINTFRELEHDELHVEAAQETVLSESLAVRVAGLHSSLGGWVFNPGTGEHEGSQQQRAARLALAWAPRQDFTANIKIETGNSTTQGRNLEISDCPPRSGAAGTCALVLATAINQGAVGFDDHFDAVTFYQGPVPTAFTSSVATFGTMEAQTVVPQPATALTTPDAAAQDQHTLMLNLDWQLPQGQQLTALSGYTDHALRLTQSTDFLPLPLAAAQQHETFTQFSQELRLAATADARHPWLAGLYWQQNRMELDETLQFYLPPPYFQPAATWFTDTCRSVPNNPACRWPATIASQTSAHQQRDHTKALFAAWTWTLHDNWQSTFGFRYQRSSKQLQRAQHMLDLAPGITVTCPPAGAAATLRCESGRPLLMSAASPPLGTAFGWRTGMLALQRLDAAFTPSWQMQWRPTETLMLYTSYSQGFKPGGFDQRNLFLDPVLGQFAPERVISREAGMKASLFAGNLDFNLALFRSTYANLQVSTFDGVVNFLVNNAASARSQGLELELRWLLGESLQLGSSLALLDAYWLDYRAGQCTAMALQTAPNSACQLDPQRGLLVQDLSGQPLPMAPRYSGNVSLEQVLHLAAGFEVHSQVLLYMQDGQLLAADNDPATRQSRYSKLDLRVALVHEQGWELALVARNVTNEITAAHAEDLPLGATNSYFRLTERPRSMALQFRYRW